ncbi:transposase [Dactylosporangium sp. NPDC048998]|uniref:transposase n=1 Tax=Dactylosporangium sp. NPDC048998 TaxID=3363976 RepID=UPI00371D0491
MRGGGRRIDDRIALAVILYVLDSGCAWDELPASFPISSKTTHRRFTEWVALGVMAALHQATLDVLGAAGQIDWSRASIDAHACAGGKGGTSRGRAR